MKINAAERGRARRIAMQALYQWHITQNPVHIIDADCHKENDMTKVDVEYFTELFHNSLKMVSDLDALFKPFLVNISFVKIDPVTLAIMRLSCYELKERMDVPYRVIINEALNLAKKYGAADSHKFINGILDKVASGVREAEFKAAKAKKK
jgi:N utilization substance protein B